MKKYKVAVIGCGNVASLFDKELKGGMAFSHAGAYQTHPQTQLVAACDLDEKRLNEFAAKWNISRLYTDHRELLRHENIDILSVCTPPSTHYSIVRDASKARLKAIFCEKPIALKTADAQKMVELCNAARILLMVNHQRRFSPFWQEVKLKMEQGFFGEIQQVGFYYTRGIYNTGVHILDLFNFLFGEAVWTMASISKNRSPFPNDPNIDGVIRFKNGVSVHLQPCDDSNYLIFEMNILASQGRIRIGRQLEYFKVEMGKNLLSKKELSGPVPCPIQVPYGPDSFVNGLDHIIRCLEKKQKPVSSGSDALQSLRIIEAMLRSASLNKPVVMEKKNEKK